MQHRYVGPEEPVEVNLTKQGDAWTHDGHRLELHGERLKITLADGTVHLAHAAKTGDVWWVHLNGHTFRWERMEPGATSSGHDGGLAAPMPGKVLEVLVDVGQSVTAGDALMVLEAMKMEHRIVATSGGVVTAVHFQANDQVAQGAALLSIEESN
ncbi:MAG: biotin/lipoyl-binding protein [archaeon]|jgi:3-methylcrotonyl-CoA carboxylase alpha subunit|nr:biotin/lipoyl-binding protein [archaeon]